MNEQYCYYLMIHDDRLSLVIVSLPENNNTEKPNGEMEILYAVSFYQGEKVIHVECDFYGNMDMWLAMIREGKVWHIVNQYALSQQINLDSFDKFWNIVDFLIVFGHRMTFYYQDNNLMKYISDLITS